MRQVTSVADTPRMRTSLLARESLISQMTLIPSQNPELVTRLRHSLRTEGSKKELERLNVIEERESKKLSIRSESTCTKRLVKRYGHIKTSSALLERIRENSTKIMKKDTGSIENRLFTQKLKDVTQFDHIMMKHRRYMWISSSVDSQNLSINKSIGT